MVLSYFETQAMSLVFFISRKSAFVVQILRDRTQRKSEIRFQLYFGLILPVQ